VGNFFIRRSLDSVNITNFTSLSFIRSHCRSQCLSSVDPSRHHLLFALLIFDPSQLTMPEDANYRRYSLSKTGQNVINFGGRPTRNSANTTTQKIRESLQSDSLGESPSESSSISDVTQSTPPPSPRNGRSNAAKNGKNAKVYRSRIRGYLTMFPVETDT
jgi:hypothetical protein